MPLLEIKLKQTYAGQEIENVFAYQGSGTPAAVSFSFALASAFGAVPAVGVYPPTGIPVLMTQLQSNQLSYDLISVRDPYSNTDFYETPFIPSLVGTIATEGASPVLAFGLFTNRTRQDIRRGQKRIAGVTEDFMDAQGVVDTAVAAGRLATLAARMTDNLTYDDEGQTLTFTPIIVSKQCYNPATGTTPCPETGKAYRWYPTEAEQLTHIATSVVWSAYDVIKTQGSRQYGRGR